MSDEWPVPWNGHTPIVVHKLREERMYNAIPIDQLAKATGEQGWQLDHEIPPFEAAEYATLTDRMGEPKLIRKVHHVMVWMPRAVWRQIRNREELAANSIKESDEREQRSLDRIERMADKVVERWEQLEAAHRMGGRDAVKALLADLKKHAELYDGPPKLTKRKY